MDSEFKESKKIETLGDYGAILSLIEVGLGSLLHAFKIPFSGMILSLNQGFILCRSVVLMDDTYKSTWQPYSISNVAAVLKSLSPAGKKLGPMLSLSMQGLLFNLGVFFLGQNLLGLCLGMALLSIWTFVQPLITYYLFFGNNLFNAAEYMFQKTLPYHGLSVSSLQLIFCAFIAVKMLLAIALAFVAWRIKGKSIYQSGHEEKLIDIAKKSGAKMIKEDSSPHKNALYLSLMDLTRPIFLVSILMTALFLYFSQHNYAQIIWYLLRPLAIGFVFFYISRTLTLDRWLVRIEGGKFRSFSLECQAALKKIRKIL